MRKKYPHVGWFVSDSTTDGDLARKETIKTHKRGRPKQVVHGRRVSRHVHLGAVGDGKKSAYSFAKEIGRAFDKRYSKNLYRPMKVTSVRSMRKYNYNGEIKTNGANFVYYSYRQANAFYSGGKFNFKPLLSPTYYECVETSEEERNRLLERRKKRREKKAAACNNRYDLFSGYF